MRFGAQKLAGATCKRFHGDTGKRVAYPIHQRGQIAVIPAIMLGGRVAQPGIVFFNGSFPWLFLGQLGSLARHFHPTLQEKIELDVHRFFAPQRAVIVKNGDALLLWDAGQAVTVGYFQSRNPESPAWQVYLARIAVGWPL